MTSRPPPSVETLAVELRGLRDVLAERDKRLDERFKAQESALAMATSQLSEYKTTANEWRGALADAQYGISKMTVFVMGAGIILSLVLGAVDMLLRQH